MKSIKAFLKYWFWYYKFLFFIRKDAFLNRASEQHAILYSAMLWALKEHHSVRQKYDGYPYFFHLNQVANVALKFKYLVDNNGKTYLGALFHDTIEDIHKYTYNDIKKLWGQEVADIVFACTELRGRDRDERHGQEYYDLLKTTKEGTFVKVCDVIANMERGMVTGSSMLNKYIRDYPHFKAELYREDLGEMFRYIENEIIAKSFK